MIFAGAAERGRLATTFKLPDNRPSEHSGENQPELADEPREFRALTPRGSQTESLLGMVIALIHNK